MAPIATKAATRRAATGGRSTVACAPGLAVAEAVGLCRTPKSSSSPVLELGGQPESHLQVAEVGALFYGGASSRSQLQLQAEVLQVWRTRDLSEDLSDYSARGDTCADPKKRVGGVHVVDRAAPDAGAHAS
jgi:hypothetical protein